MTAPTPKPKAQRGLLFGMLAVIALVTAAGFTIMLLRFCRPMRLSDGTFMWARVIDHNRDDVPWREYCRSFGELCWAVRWEYDLDGDGQFDCREDECPSNVRTRWAACVSRRINGEWVPQPEIVLDCGAPWEPSKMGSPHSVTPSAPPRP
jgi:hypothetical protein